MPAKALPPAAEQQCTPESEAARLDALEAERRGIPSIAVDRTPLSARGRRPASAEEDRAWADRMVEHVTGPAGAARAGVGAALPYLGTIDLGKVDVPVLEFPGAGVEIEVAMKGKLRVKADDPAAFQAELTSRYGPDGQKLDEKSLDLAVQHKFDSGLSVNFSGVRAAFDDDPSTQPSLSVGGVPFGGAVSVTVGPEGLTAKVKAPASEVKLPLGEGLTAEGKLEWEAKITRRGDDHGGQEDWWTDLPLLEVATAFLTMAALMIAYRANPSLVQHAYATGLVAMPGNINADPTDPASPFYDHRLEPI